MKSDTDHQTNPEPSMAIGGVKRVTIALILLTLTIFGLFSFQQAKIFDPKLAITELSSKGFFSSLHTWQVDFFNCENTCQKSNDDPYTIDFPASTDAFGEIKKKIPSSNTAKLTFQVSQQAIASISQVGGEVNLVIPRSAQTSVYGAVGDREYQILVGNDQDIVWTIRAADLKIAPEIEIFFNLPKNWTWFGPSSFPIAMMEPGNTRRYTEIATAQSFLKYLRADWYILFPLIIALINLVIDFSWAFRIFAAYCASFSVRTYFYGFIDSPNWANDIGLILLNTAVAVFLLGFCVKTWEVFQPSKKVWIYFTALIAVMMALIAVFDPAFRDLADAYIDTGSAVFSIILIGISFFRLQKTHSISTLDWVKFALMFAALIFIAKANLSDAFSFHDGFKKDPFQMGHVLPFGLFFLASIISLGSIERMMTRAVHRERELAKHSAELEMGRVFQNSILPKNRSLQGNDFCWHSYSRPLYPIGGDWHDIDLISIGRKRFIMGCIFDATGNGIIAAQHIPAVLVKWNISKTYFEKMLMNYSEDAIDNFIFTAASDLNEGLLHIPGNLGGSSLIFIIDLQLLTLNCVGNGHPGILVQKGGKFSHFNEYNEYLGKSKLQDFKPLKIDLNSPCEVFIFSTGMWDEELKSQVVGESGSQNDDFKQICIWINTSKRGDNPPSN